MFAVIVVVGVSEGGVGPVECWVARQAGKGALWNPRGFGGCSSTLIVFHVDAPIDTPGTLHRLTG